MMQKFLYKLYYKKQWYIWQLWKSYIENKVILSLQKQFKQSEINIHKFKYQYAELLLKKWKLNIYIPYYNQWKIYTTLQKEKKYQLIHKVIAKVYHSSFIQWKNYIQVIKQHEIQKNLFQNTT